MNFQPDYRHILDAAYNREAKRLPLYEHNVSPVIMERITGKEFAHLLDGTPSDQEEFFRQYCGFFRDHGYDVVTFEGCIGLIMPGSGALGNSRITPAIQTREDFEKYPWDEVPEKYFQRYSPMFKALGKSLPPGMRAIGGVGNGVFECVQDLVGYQNLCYIGIDDPKLYSELFQKMGEVSQQIWAQFLKEFGELYCVLRFGDDLGFNSSTLLSPDDIRAHIIPEYKNIIQLVHSYSKPFLLHSCGSIFEVMEDLITVAGIDAKHSNEDDIALFPQWVERYGNRIGNFGGIDTDAVCRLDKGALKDYIHEVLLKCKGHGGFAFGSGNSIPDYVPYENYVNMIEIVREFRGDY